MKAARTTERMSDEASRRLQRRPDLSMKVNVPQELRDAIANNVIPHVDKNEPSNVKLENELRAFASSTTPDQQIRILGQVSAAIRGALPSSSAPARPLLTNIVTDVLLPIFFDMRVRYCHKAVLNCIRNVIRDNVELMKVAVEAFRARLASFVSTSIAQEAPTVDDLMEVANVLDALNIAAVPTFYSTFNEATSILLPLYAKVLRGTLHSAVDEAGCKAIFGADLDRVRFVVRVIATLVHKFIATVSEIVFDQSAVRVDNSAFTALNTIFSCALDMLSSEALPKDLLNAAGLLVATCLTLSPPSTAADRTSKLRNNIAHICRFQQGSSTGSRDTFLQQWLHDLDKGIAYSGSGAVVDAVKGFTVNGKLAFFRGLLSHVVGAAKKLGDEGTVDPELLGLLLSGPEYVAFDVMFAEALSWASQVDNPETRFLAIQTIDSIVRHIRSVLSSVAEDIMMGREDARLPAFVNESGRLRQCLIRSTDVIMAVWDDPTQQVSGPLYDTYANIFSVDEARQECLREGSAPLISVQESLVAVLSMRADRRGKYHALLALIPRVSSAELWRMVAASMGKKVSEDTPLKNYVGVIQEFASATLRSATHTKVSSVVGEVFSAIATTITDRSPDNDTRSLLWEEVLVTPMVNAIVGTPEAAGAVERQLLANTVINYMLTPLMKQHKSMLKTFLDRVQGVSKGVMDTVRVRAVCEILSRAKNAGLPIESLLPFSDALEHSDAIQFTSEALQFALDSYDTNLRSSAVALSVLSNKGAALVTDKQIECVEKFFAANMHNGGDTTFRNDIIGILKRWCKRLEDSTASLKAMKNAPNADGKKQVIKADAFEASWSVYVSKVLANIASLASVFQSNLEFEDYSIERRYTALSMWKTVLGAAFAVLKSSESHALARKYLALREDNFALDSNSSEVTSFCVSNLRSLLPQEMLSILLRTMGEGWDRIRGMAAGVLEYYRQLYTGDEIVALVGAGTAANVLQEEVRQIVSNLMDPLFRGSDGSVERLIFFLELPYTTPISVEFAVGNVKTTIVASGAEKRAVFESAVAITKATTEAISKFCTACRDNAGDLTKLFTVLHDEPVHGLLQIVSSFAVLGLKNAPDAKAKKNLLELLPDLMAACESTLDVCTKLVSGAGDDEDTPGAALPDVDCRGHIIGDNSIDNDQFGEAYNRIIINNAWVGVKATTAAIENITAAVRLPSETLPPVLLERIGFALIKTLLRTKHNGVMNRSRNCLAQLCSTLLRTKDDEHFSIPRKFVAFLLGDDGVRSTDKDRILRRSQGLPHAIVPILEAEDPSVPFVLFPQTMGELLSIASSDVADNTDIRSMHRVNALNVIKFILENSTFSGRVVPFAQEAFLIAAKGFHSTHWEVRNSSLMVFASAVLRLIGTGTTLKDLAGRAPDAMKFVEDELRTAVNAAVKGFEIHPALFPLLLMLSQLHPDSPHAVDDGSGDTFTSRLVATVAQCRTSRTLMVRAASAGSMYALIPANQLLQNVELMLGELSPSKNQNSIHGALVHLHLLVSRYCGSPFPSDRKFTRTVQDSDSGDAVGAAVIQHLSSNADWAQWARSPHAWGELLAIIADLGNKLPTNVGVGALLNTAVRFGHRCQSILHQLPHEASAGCFVDFFGRVLAVATLHSADLANTVLSVLKDETEKIVLNNSTQISSIVAFADAANILGEDMPGSIKTFVADTTLAVLRTYDSTNNSAAPSRISEVEGARSLLQFCAFQSIYVADIALLVPKMCREWSTHCGFRRWAVRYGLVAVLEESTLDAKAREGAATAIVSLVAEFAGSSNAYETRLACAEGISNAFERLIHRDGTFWIQMRWQLLWTLLVLVHDDEERIRGAACRAAAVDAKRSDAVSQFWSASYIASMLSSVADTLRTTSSVENLRAIAKVAIGPLLADLKSASVAAANAAADRKKQLLFEEESENMFIELPTMEKLVSSVIELI